MITDVSEYESVIRREGQRRYANNQRLGIEGMTNKDRAVIQHTLGVAGEIAARIYLGLNPYEVENDEIGAPDLVDWYGNKVDVKVVRADHPVVNINYYDGVLDRKANWRLMVMMYEGYGWRFRHALDMAYGQLADRPTLAPSGGHRSRYWSIDLRQSKDATP